jgi:hypothetical protein
MEISTKVYVALCAFGVYLLGLDGARYDRGHSSTAPGKSLVGSLLSLYYPLNYPTGYLCCFVAQTALF